MANPEGKVPAGIGCVMVLVVAGAIGFNALFCHAGYVDESEGTGLRLLIGGVLGLLFGLLVVLDDREEIQ